MNTALTNSTNDIDADPLAATKKYLVAQFTKRDLMLYALGIGCGSGSSVGDTQHDGDDVNNRELRYVYEENLEVFPSFLLALSFVAEREYQYVDDGIQCTHATSFGIRSFPPESMMHYLEDGTKCGLLPMQCFTKQDIDIVRIQSLPILHVSQSLILHDEIKLFTDDYHNSLDPPTQVRLETKIVSVEPRNKGTLVTSETTYHQFGKCIATAQMVALIVGLDRDLVVPLKATTPSAPLHKIESDNRTGSTSKRDNIPAGRDISRDISNERTVVRYRIPHNAALLYRLSGDYNPIHVHGSLLSSDTAPAKSRPVLHGLCTLGYALRGVLNHVSRRQLNKNNEREEESQMRLVSFRCNFVKPVFVNDALCVEVWDDDKVIRSSDDEKLCLVCFYVYQELPLWTNVETEIERRVMVLVGEAKFRRRRPVENFVRAISML